MGTRTVRLDEKTEQALRKLRRTTGLSISEVLKRGVEAYAERMVQEPPATPYEVFKRVHDATAVGGWARGPARDAKATVREVIRRRHGK
ncbi:MAG TPA: ribbon-helix-helix protein, CopG family [Verrucomicrobiae bacterium]|nr:ribbon-helix-helix protein, CopG family [Verrucomicrobiae bacterium]